MRYIKPELDIKKYIISDIMCASGTPIEGGAAGGIGSDGDPGWAPVQGGSAS